MNGTVGRNFNPRKSADQTLANFSSIPGGVLVLQVQDVVLYLEGQLVRVVMGPPASIGEPLNATFLIAVEDLVTGLTRDAELPAQLAIASPASRRATNCILSSIAEHSFQGITPSSLEEESVTHVSGTMCYLCVEPLTR